MTKPITCAMCGGEIDRTSVFHTCAAVASPDYLSGPLDLAALAGTQTDDGAGAGSPVPGVPLAPSSPDRIEAAVQALAAHEVEQRRSDLTAVCVCGFDFDPLHFGEPWHTHLGEAAVAALDAYDREHPKPDLRGKVVGAAQIEAALRERIAAEVEAKGHPHGFHREGWSQEDAGAFCSNCEITARDARIVRGGA